MLLLAAVLLVGVSSMWGETKTITLDYNSLGLTGSYAEKTATVSGVGFTIDQGYKGSNNVIQMNSSKGSGILYNTTAITGLKSISVNVYTGNKTYTITTGAATKPTANSQTGTSTGTYNAASGDTYFQLKVSGASYFSSIVITYEDASSSNLTASDFTLTDAPIALSFDLYNNSSAQVINYTTSGTGAVTVSESGYVNCVVNETAKTITVTPTAVTPSTQTITVSQAADATYAGGSKTFTVSIDDSTPFFGGDVTFTSGTDMGSTLVTGPDQMSKSVVTVSSTSAALATDEYRLYSGSTTTISTTKGKITKIVLTIVSSYDSSDLSTTTGTYSKGTWTGKATSVDFKAKAQVRASKIVVTVENKPDIATINSITPTSINVGADGSFTYDITYATGATANDATISWTSNDEDVLANIDGEYLAGNAEGTANVTVTVTPNDANTYNAVSKTFAVSVVDSRTAIATINGITPTSVNVEAEGSFVYDIVFAEGTSTSDYTVSYNCGDTNALIVDNDGSYLVGSEVGSVNVTVTVVPTNSTTYKSVSQVFAVTIVNPNAKGTINNPYTVAEVQNGDAKDKTGVYATGFIVGSWKNSSLDDNLVDTNLALADSYGETTSAKTIPVELPNTGDLRSTWGPSSNSYNIHVAKVKLKGNGEAYFSKDAIKGTSEIVKVAEQVTITSAGMATYYTDCALDFTGFDDMYAYTAKLNGTTITFTRINKVPAQTGILLYNPNKESASNLVPVATETETVSGNVLVGTLTDLTVSTEGCYVLSNGSNGPGFYKVKSEGGNKVAAHRAYLDANGATVRSFIGLDDDETLGVSNTLVNHEGREKSIYDLTGRRVALPVNGLYIVNGKKALFK